MPDPTSSRLLRRAAEDGAVNAQFWLGLMYENGSGVKRNRQQSLKWFLKAAKQGNSDAQVSLGQAYEDGDGVPQDYHKPQSGTERLQNTFLTTEAQGKAATISGCFT